MANPIFKIAQTDENDVSVEKEIGSTFDNIFLRIETTDENTGTAETITNFTLKDLYDYIVNMSENMNTIEMSATGPESSNVKVWYQIIEQ